MAKGKPAPLTDEERAELLLMSGKVSGDESPETFEAMLTKLKGQGYQPIMPVMGNNAARRILKGATMSGSEYLAEKAGAAPLSPGDLGDTGLEIAGGFIPALLLGGPMGAAAQSTKLAPLFKAAPRIASTVAGMAENALLGGVQAGFEGESMGEGAAWGAGISGIIEGPMRAIGAIYAKGIRLPPMGPKLPKGKIDPTLAKPFEKPRISLWEGMNTGLKRIAEKWGIDLPLISARPNDKFAAWVIHKAGQLEALKPYLSELDAKNDQTFKKGFEGIIDALGTERVMEPREAGVHIIDTFNRLVNRDLKGSASALYEQILDIGLENGQQLRNFRVNGKELASQLRQVLDSRGFIPDTKLVPGESEVNKIRNLIAKLEPPSDESLQKEINKVADRIVPIKRRLATPRKEKSSPYSIADELRDKLDNLSQQQNDLIYSQNNPQPKTELELNQVWNEGKKLFVDGGGNDASAAREASALVRKFIRDTAADINPNTGGAFAVADTWWSKYHDLKESEIGKILTLHPEEIVDKLTQDVTTIKQVKDMLNDVNVPQGGGTIISEGVGDRFVEILAKQRLKDIIAKSVDPRSHVLDFGQIESQIDALAGPPSARREYMQELFGAKPEVLKAFEELHSLMRVIDIPRDIQAPKQGNVLQGSGAELASAEKTLTNLQTIGALLIRWAYGSELGKFMTTTPAAQNPLLGGLRPAMGPERRPIQLLNTLRRGAGSVQRNLP